MYLKSFALILRFSRGARYHQRIVYERDPNFSNYQRVAFQKCGSLVPQKKKKKTFLIVFYTAVNIQFSQLQLELSCRSGLPMHPVPREKYPRKPINSV